MVSIQASSNFASGNTVFVSRILRYPSPSKMRHAPCRHVHCEGRKKKKPCDGLKWFKLKKMSKCQQDVKMSKRCQNVKKMSNCQKDVKLTNVKKVKVQSSQKIIN